MSAQAVGKYILALGAMFTLVTFTLALWGIWTHDPETAQNITDTAWCFGVPGVFALMLGGLMQLD